MKLRPILFSTAMIQALLAGTKTQTRRTIEKDCTTLNHPESEFVGFTYASKTKQNTLAHFRRKGQGTFFAGYNSKFGAIGDVLWVKETWRRYWVTDPETDKPDMTHIITEYRADGRADKIPLLDGNGDPVFNKDGSERFIPWKSSMYMPFDVARLFLEITNIRVERLQDISEADSIAEGIKRLSPWPENPDSPRYEVYSTRQVSPEQATFDPVFSYFSLWDSINGSGSVKENPFVWVYDFKVVDKPAI